MKEANNEPEKEPEASALSENVDENRVSSNKDPSEQVKQKGHETMEEYVKESKKRMTNLLRDQMALVTNIQTVADSKVVQERRKLKEAKKLRSELLESDAKSSQEIFDEFSRGLLIVNEKVNLQDLQEALNKQQQLCAALIQNKKKLISELQQELKIGGDRYLKALRKNVEELDLMILRIESQVHIVTKAYREELEQTKRVYQQEIKFLLTKDIAEWEKDLNEIWDEELKHLKARRKKVKEYEKRITETRLEEAQQHQTLMLEEIVKKQVLEKKNQQVKNATFAERFKCTWKERVTTHLLNTLENVQLRINCLEKKIKSQKKMHIRQQKEFAQQNHILSDKYKRKIQKYERLEQQAKHFTAADAKRFEEMRLMVEEEVKELAEKALLLDFRICKQVLGCFWKPSHMASSDLSSPSQPQEPAPNVSNPLIQTDKFSQEKKDAECTLNNFSESVVHSDSDPDQEEVKFSKKKQMEIMTLICNEMNFLMEAQVLKLLGPLENEEQTGVKLGSFLYSLGIDDKKVPELTDFLLKYAQQQREQAEDAHAESTNSTSELIDPNHVLPALKSFLEYKQLKEGSANQHSSFRKVDPSDEKAYWESLGNVISDGKIKLWDATEQKLKQYHAVLTEISDLTVETERLEQRNAELRVELQQRLSSTV